MKIFDKLNDFWFGSISPDRLSLFRIIIGIYSFYVMYVQYTAYLIKGDAIGKNPRYLFDQVGVVNLINNPLDTTVFKAILLATLIANIFFIFGLLFRISGPLFSILFLFMVSYSHSWSMVYHSQNIAVLHCLVLGFTKSADTNSFDELIKKALPESNKLGFLFGNGAGNGPSWQYGWPIMLINSLTVLTYLLAGVAKVMGPLGIYWVLGESVRSQVAVDAIRKEFISTGAQPLAFFLYNKVYIFTAIGISTLILEIGAPLAIINRRIGYIWSILAFAMHWGIYFIMGITFRYQMSGIVFLPFFEIEKVPSYLKNFILKLFLPKSYSTN